MKNYYILKPKNLNLDNRLEKFPPDFDFNKDCAYYIISKLIKNLSKQNLGDFSKTIKIFTSLCAQINEKTVRDTKKYLDYFYNNFPGEGRLLWRKNYQKGKCFSYRLPEYYWGDGELEIICITRSDLITKIKKVDTPHIANIVKKKFNFTIDYFNATRFELDEIGAMDIIYKQYQESGNFNKYLSNAVKILEFKNGHYSFYHSPDTDGRLHTEITFFPKICRQFLKYDGENLAETDLSSSIPFFLSYVFSIPNNSNKSKILNTQINSKDLINHYMLAESSETPCSKEIAYFKELIINNQLYEHFMDDFTDLPSFESNFLKQFGRIFDGDEEDLKKFSKRRFLSMLFADPQDYIDEQSIFYKYFPSISNLIKKFKKLKFRSLRKADRHKKLSYLAFQLEAHFMINIIAREINNLYKRKIPFFTLHDCIVVKESDLEIVHQIIKDIFIREIGYTPNLTKKIWI